MVNLAIIDTLATDWTGQTWAERLRACAETLYIHHCIDFDAYNAALDRLEDAAALAKSSPSLPRGGGPLPQAGVEGHSSARIVHKPTHGGYPEPEIKGSALPFCLIPNCQHTTSVGHAFCHRHRNLANPDVLPGDKALSRDLLEEAQPSNVQEMHIAPKLGRVPGYGAVHTDGSRSGGQPPQAACGKEGRG